MLNFYDIEQNTDAWQALRLGKATASQFGCFMANLGKAFGEPAKRYALQLALERITKQKASVSFTNEHMERGHEQEPIARMLYEEETFCKVTNGGFFGCDTYGDSPDGRVGTKGVVEIKSVMAPVHYDNILRGKFDPAYRWQLVGHLDCTGCDWIDFISYCADFPLDRQLFIDRLHRDDWSTELRLLAERRAEFLALVDEIEANVRGEDTLTRTLRKSIEQARATA